MKEWTKLSIYTGVFLAAYFIPFNNPKVESAILESFKLLGDYAREHVLLCLIPAFFIAGAITVFVSQNAVLKYLGPNTRRWLSYPVASLSGSVLAVCSCTILPLFSGIYKRGAGIGPAVAFLYSGPAINVLAIILTARVLGWELGLARAVGAIIFSIIIGLIMAFLYGKEDEQNSNLQFVEDFETEQGRTGSQNLLYFLNLVLILIFMSWAKPENQAGFWYIIYKYHWPITIILLLVLVYMLTKWFNKDEIGLWLESTWDFAKKILPLLLAGILIAGFFMGRPNSDGGIIPSEWISTLVGGNSFMANLIASVVGAFMYFATLTEIPIIQGLIGAGMGEGPVLALLLAGPTLSLPNMLVIRSTMGTKRTITYITLVIIMATISGMFYGNIIN